MKERPILFSAPMVRAILAGTKTQTRRAMKPQPANDIKRTTFPNPEAIGWISSLRHAHGTRTAHFCQYGRPGDRLWVREAWRVIDLADVFAPREITAAHRIWFEADGPHEPPAGRYRQAMFMPRWASRILLDVTEVRVERLNDISEADARSEGCRSSADTLAETGFATARDSYRNLWESINGAGSWDENPWVWAISFRRVMP